MFFFCTQKNWSELCEKWCRKLLHQFSWMWLILGNYTKYMPTQSSHTHSIQSTKKKFVHLLAISIFNCFWKHATLQKKKRIPEAIIIHLWSTSIPATIYIPPFHANWIDRNWIISWFNLGQQCSTFDAIWYLEIRSSAKSHRLAAMIKVIAFLFVPIKSLIKSN